MQRIAQYLAASDVGAELYEGLGFLLQLLVVVQSVIVYGELMACIHGKLVDDGLAEQAVVLIGGTQRLPPAITSALMEIVERESCA